MDYKSSGVDVEAGRAFIDRIRSSVDSTRRSEVIGGMGGFGGLMRLPKGFSNPLLVAGTDGVGTKLELAQDYSAHFGVGLDLVAMCVNDVITSGAQPLFFLDYIASGTLAPNAMVEVVEGIAEGCRQSKCALLGGETAEMPGFYPQGRYDLAGFCVGVVEEDLLVDGRNISAGDQIIGISSSGVHSNGFSLVRKVLSYGKVNENTVFGEQNSLLINALLTPTILYGGLIESLITEKVPIKGMANITGGGLPENLPRCLPDGLIAHVDINSWQKPELFKWLQEVGDIPEEDLWNTFNLGVGFCLVVAPDGADAAIKLCQDSNRDAWLMGRIEECIPGKKVGVMGLPY